VFFGAVPACKRKGAARAPSLMPCSANRSPWSSHALLLASEFRALEALIQTLTAGASRVVLERLLVDLGLHLNARDTDPLFPQSTATASPDQHRFLAVPAGGQALPHGCPNERRWCEGAAAEPPVTSNLMFYNAPACRVITSVGPFNPATNKRPPDYTAGRGTLVNRPRRRQLLGIRRFHCRPGNPARGWPPNFRSPITTCLDLRELSAFESFTGNGPHGCSPKRPRRQQQRGLTPVSSGRTLEQDGSCEEIPVCGAIPGRAGPLKRRRGPAVDAHCG
jgi:hypothetical protein